MSCNVCARDGLPTREQHALLAHRDATYEQSEPRELDLHLRGTTTTHVSARFTLHDSSWTLNHSPEQGGHLY